MKSLNTSPISGMQEFLPARQAIFDQMKQEIARVYHLHGFESIETPIIDRTEILLAKAGGDTEKQIYRVVKTAEAADGADQALRFDHTVPLARYVVEHESALAFPLRATQIGRNFRGERAQKGRFREFYQCDMDIIGRGELPLAYDAEVLLTLLDALRAILTQRVLLRVSNRKILAGLVEYLGLSQVLPQISSIIDHAEKVSSGKTAGALLELGLDERQKSTIEQFMQIAAPRAEAISALHALGVDNDTFEVGLSELDEVLSMAESGLDSDDALIVADMSIIRGLDYYTGTVFEAVLPDYKQIGSVGGGGRYENLASHFTDQKFPGVGGSIGLSRLFFILSEYNLLQESEFRPINYAIIPISPAETPASFALAARLRKAGYITDIVLTNKRLGDRLAYAAKNATAAVIVGENEVASGEYSAKNLITGETVPLKI